ncbi:MAG TPA: hypothetical protein VMI32_07740 [Candidatus Solibacter sp.]|nr:hypothetical protein [Candidatus Solibacter sp.]
MYAPSEAGQLCEDAEQRVTQKLPWAAQTKLLARIVPLKHCGVKRKDYKGLWYGCGGASDW